MNNNLNNILTWLMIKNHNNNNNNNGICITETAKFNNRTLKIIDDSFARTKSTCTTRCNDRRNNTGRVIKLYLRANNCLMNTRDKRYFAVVQYFLLTRFIRSARSFSFTVHSVCIYFIALFPLDPHRVIIA